MGSRCYDSSPASCTGTASPKVASPRTARSPLFRSVRSFVSSPADPSIRADRVADNNLPHLLRITGAKKIRRKHCMSSMDSYLRLAMKTLNRVGKSKIGVHGAHELFSPDFISTCD